MRLKDILETKNQLEVLEMITRAYSEAASTSMKKTRTGVLQNREFISDLSSIFEDVRAEYASAHTETHTNDRNLTFLAHNGKTVSVLLSSESGLYGSIVSETFQLFKNEVDQNNTEITIAGKQGAKIFSSSYPNRAYTYFELDDAHTNQEQLGKIAKHIVQYDEIHLFYGKFHSVLVQRPEMLPIRSQIDVTSEKKNRTRYIFEPDLNSILRFFESELFASLLTQTVQESTLAKLASRVLAMDSSSDRIQLEQKKLTKVAERLRHAENNKKQLNSLSAILNTL